MSLQSRKEYVKQMQDRYRKTKSRADKSSIVDEIVNVVHYNRKYVLQMLNGLVRPPGGKERRRQKQYLQAVPVIQAVWKTLDFPCAERLHPVLLETADKLATHGHVTLSPLIRAQLAQISRTTLGRRLSKWVGEKPVGKTSRSAKSFSRLRSEIPVQRYNWDEKRPGALEIDLVEHNGGSSLGHFAYTLVRRGHCHRLQQAQSRPGPNNMTSPEHLSNA